MEKKTYYPRISSECDKTKSVKINKQKTELHYLSKKLYNEILQNSAAEDEVSVIGYTSLKEAKDKDDAQLSLSGDMLVGVNRKQKRFCRVYGYVDVGEYKYIALQRLSVIPLLLLLLALLLIALFCKSCVSDKPNPWNPETDPSAPVISDETDNSTQRNNAISVDGFTTWHIPAGKSEKLSIKLRNPEGNPCYFGFVISLDETGEKLCETKLVAPNHEIKQVTITHALEKGTYPATISISTYELETGAPMNGAEMKINIIVS